MKHMSITDLDLAVFNTCTCRTGLLNYIDHYWAINGHTNVNLHFVSSKTVWDWGIPELGDPLNRSYSFHATQ